MAQSPLDRLEERIGYKFENKNLLVEALTHSSYVQDLLQRTRDNELMEFLGDAVLSFAVTVRLVEAFPEYDEGMLSLARANLVAASHLGRVAAELNLGDYLLLGSAEERTGGRRKAGILVNALEAVVAAVYRDGGLKAAREFVDRIILPRDLPKYDDEFFSTNYKGNLQEHLQAERKPPAQYRVVQETGLEHQKTFIVEVRAGDSIAARGCGASKKAAEQQAARHALELLGKKAETNG